MDSTISSTAQIAGTKGINKYANFNDPVFHDYPKSLDIELMLFEISDHIAIQNLDPIGFDELLDDLISINHDNYLKVIEDVKQKLKKLSFEKLSRQEAIACLRDLGMLCASLKRNGIIIPKEFEQSLTQLSIISNEVPRDTVYSYGPRNPSGNKTRKFTDIPEERAFIDSFTGAIEGLYGTIIEMLCRKETNQIKHLVNAKEQFDLMIRGMVSTKKHVPPEIFTHKLRPFFDPLEVDGVFYDAPGGAQMPLIIIDLFIRGGNTVDPVYLEYVNRNLKYCPEGTRNLGYKFLKEPSILELMQEGKITHDKELINRLIDIINGMISFRTPHARVAQENFNIRQKTDVGSGGYSPVFLNQMIDLTKMARKQFEELI